MIFLKVTVESVEDVSVEELENSPVAGITMRKGEFTNLAGFCITCTIDGVASEIILLNEEIPYMKWWHDKSFFTLNYYNEHIKCLKGLSVKSKVRRRIVLSFLLDKDINLDKFHTVNTFLTDDGKETRLRTALSRFMTSTSSAFLMRIPSLPTGAGS